MSTASFLDILRRMVETANADPVACRLGRHCTARVLLAAGDTGAYLDVRGGRIDDLTPGLRHLRSYHFALRARWPTWQEFWSPLPSPGFHDIFALARYGHATIEGNLDPLLEHLSYFKRLLWIPRGFARQ